MITHKLQKYCSQPKDSIKMLSINTFVQPNKGIKPFLKHIVNYSTSKISLI